MLRPFRRPADRAPSIRPGAYRSRANRMVPGGRRATPVNACTSVDTTSISGASSGKSCPGSGHRRPRPATPGCWGIRCSATEAGASSTCTPSLAGVLSTESGLVRRVRQSPISTTAVRTSCSVQAPRSMFSRLRSGARRHDARTHERFPVPEAGHGCQGRQSPVRDGARHDVDESTGRMNRGERVISQSLENSSTPYSGGGMTTFELRVYVLAVHVDHRRRRIRLFCERLHEFGCLGRVPCCLAPWELGRNTVTRLAAVSCGTSGFVVGVERRHIRCPVRAGRGRL